MKANKAKAIVRLVLWTVVGVLALSVFVSIMNTYKLAFQHYSGDPTYVIKDVTISDEVQSITLNWYLGGIEVIPTDASEIRIVEKSYANMDYNKSFQTSMNQKDLTIQSRNKSFFNFFGWGITPSYLQVYLPIGKSYNKVNLNAVSGTYEFSQFITDSLEINLTSGQLKLDTITSTMLELTVVSGGVDVIDSSFDSVDITMTSGDMNYAAISNRFTADVISGKLNISFPQRPSNLDLQLTSGTVTVNVLSTEGFSVALDKTSGSFSGNLLNQDGVYRYLSGGPQYKIDMIAGNVNFNAYSE
jgi:hypothetical protein